MGDLLHAFASGKSDSGDTSLVRPSDWNDPHDIEDSSIPFYGITENPFVWDAPTGALAATFPRREADTVGAVLTSGTPFLAAIFLVEGREINDISFVSGGTALGTGTHQQFGLYASDLSRLAVTSDDTSTAWATNTTKTLSLTAPYTPTSSGLHYVAILVAATTVPTLRGRPSVGTGIVASYTPKLQGNSSSTAQVALGDPMGALTYSTVGTPYAWVS